MDSHLYAKRKYLRNKVLVLSRLRDTFKGDKTKCIEYLSTTKEMEKLQREINQLCRSLGVRGIYNYHFPSSKIKE